MNMSEWLKNAPSMCNSTLSLINEILGIGAKAFHRRIFAVKQ